MLGLLFPLVHLFRDVLAGTTPLRMRQRGGTLQMIRTNAVLSSWFFFKATWLDVASDDFDVLCDHGSTTVSPQYYRCRFMFSEIILTDITGSVGFLVIFAGLR